MTSAYMQKSFLLQTTTSYVAVAEKTLARKRTRNFFWRHNKIAARQQQGNYQKDNIRDE